jgi:hypothetical protein
LIGTIDTDQHGRRSITGTGGQSVVNAHFDRFITEQVGNGGKTIVSFCIKSMSTRLTLVWKHSFRVDKPKESKRHVFRTKLCDLESSDWFEANIEREVRQPRI